MIKSELIEEIAKKNPNLYQRDVELIVNTVLDVITGALVKGQRVELRGFGTFSVADRPARTGRNPRTGEPVRVGPKRLPRFKPGKELKERINSKAKKAA